MRNIARKVYMGIMVTILCLITLFTTTFAWIGLLDFTQFGGFDINIDSPELKEYGIEVSLTGKPNTFSSSINSNELKRVLMKNMGYATDNWSDAELNSNFKRVELNQCSTTRKSMDPTNSGYFEFNDFYDIGNQTNYVKYFKFDLYLSPYHAYEGGGDNTYKLNAYIENGLFRGTVDKNRLINKINYPSAPYSKYYNTGISNLINSDEISGDLQVDSASAVRLAIQKYEAVDKFDTVSQPALKDLIIYEGGSHYPTYNSDEDVYSFGGILEDDYNLALKDYNSKLKPGMERKSLVGQDDLLNRGDVPFNYDGTTNKIVDASTDKCGINQMIKLTVYFWFEGWDADCFTIINMNPVNLSLRLSTVYEKN